MQVTQANASRENQHKPGLRNAEPRTDSYSSEKRPPSHARQPSTISSSNWGSCQNQKIKSRRIQPIRQDICPMHGSSLCTKGDAERKVTTTMKGSGAHEERLMVLGFPSGGEKGVGDWKDYDPG